MTPSARAARMEHRRHECWGVVRRYYIDRGWVHERRCEYGDIWTLA